jgi:DNA-binding response OmpR family regulator
MSTGYSDEDIAPLLAGRPQVHSIRKPFSMKELKARIESLLLQGPDPGDRA